VPTPPRRPAGRHGPKRGGGRGRAASLSVAFPDPLAFRERHGRSPSPERAYPLRRRGRGQAESPRRYGRPLVLPSRARPISVYRVRRGTWARSAPVARSASGRCRAPAGPKRPGLRQRSGRTRSALPEKGLTCGGVRAGRRSLWFGKMGPCGIHCHGELATSSAWYLVRSTNEMCGKYEGIED
jgi:hypothetical protein